ncbi:hypothetical protein B0H10DRAFT_2228290 [Mycena sp. CBHHK59/15]|nr:hypothetical protein B0H10DRAFT_2228290 [Mycena sp. CBHHK59/15]
MRSSISRRLLSTYQVDETPQTEDDVVDLGFILKTAVPAFPSFQYGYFYGTNCDSQRVVPVPMDYGVLKPASVNDLFTECWVPSFQAPNIYLLSRARLIDNTHLGRWQKATTTKKMKAQRKAKRERMDRQYNLRSTASHINTSKFLACNELILYHMMDVCTLSTLIALSHTSQLFRELVKTLYRIRLVAMIRLFVGHDNIKTFFDVLEATESAIAGSTLAYVLAPPIDDVEEWVPSNLNIYTPLGQVGPWEEFFARLQFPTCTHQRGISRAYKTVTTSHLEYESCLVDHPIMLSESIDECLITPATAASTTMDALVEEWGKVRRTDSDAGDTMWSHSLCNFTEDSRDATYVRYEMLVDRNTRFRNLREDFELQTFYGQLTRIYRVHFPRACPALGIDRSTTYILAAIRTCVLQPDDRDLTGLDIHFYSREGSLDVIDITSVQALVGRVKDVSNEWAIIDRSGVLAQAEWVGEEED